MKQLNPKKKRILWIIAALLLGALLLCCGRGEAVWKQQAAGGLQEAPEGSPPAQEEEEAPEGSPPAQEAEEAPEGSPPAQEAEEASEEGQPAPEDGRENGNPAEGQASLSAYQDYQNRLLQIRSRSDIEQNGFTIMEEQVFEISTENFGTVTFLPALDGKNHRLVLFFADAEDVVVYRTDQLEMNFVNREKLVQTVRGISAVSFQDVNGDKRTDIVLIASCENETVEKPFQIGEVLFADEESFYRDWRVSDKINRFGMNKSIDFIIAYVRDQKSTEFLYTATTLDQLEQNGFSIISEQSYSREFEKLGRLRVVPGSITIADYELFMIYLVNEQGSIVWSFQPMALHDNLYALRGISCRDIDGDGLKDIAVLARYSDETAPGQQQIISDFAIYYQRTGGFSEDTEFKKTYTCDEYTKMEDLVKAAREYWGYVEEQE